MAINLIGFGVLLAATILCATTARLAMLEQQNSKDSRMLKWFLLLGTVWYLVLTLQYLFPAVELLAHKRGAVLPIGVMRPFLLIFIAGLSHCYSEQLPKESRFRLPVWMIYLPSVVVVSVFAAVRIGTARMFGRLPFRIESEPIIFLCFAIILYNLLIVLVCYLQITKTSERSKVWFILFSLEILLLLLSFNFWPEAIVNVRNFYDLASLLLPLPLALWLAYSRARYLFFDLLIKKTLSAILLSVFIFASISAGFFLIQVRGGSTETLSASLTPQYAIFLTLLTVPTTTIFLIVRAKIDSWVEKAFGRPNYQKAFTKLLPKLQQAQDEQTAIETVTTKLQELMQAEEVYFIKEPNLVDNLKTNQISTLVISGERTFGRLSVYARPDSLRYLSQDLIFLERVASQLAGTLLTIETQQERATQMQQQQQLREMATQAQIQALQAQINPHFLFNCLNLLNSLIRTDAESARQLMQKLATVFRYTLDSTRKELVSLQEEIDFVKNYLEIAKARFGERLSISIAVSPETTTLPVLPMLLQPLVENSLHHAIEPKVGNAKLAVSASIQDNKLKIEVVDDGVGIDSKELTRLQNGLLLTPTSSHTRLSLKNISERLRINYDCDLKIESQQGHGTNVTILIDLKKLKYKEKSL